MLTLDGLMSAHFGILRPFSAIFACGLIVSCRQCLEVQCRSSNIRDGFGKTYDRKNLCKGAPGSRHVSCFAYAG